jgi:hypothetical protein
MSVVKLLTASWPLQIATLRASTLHEHTYGMTSDPLTQFACVFSALIHDVDHQGVPNRSSLQRRTYCRILRGRSIAEQNSVDLAWALLG